VRPRPNPSFISSNRFTSSENLLQGVNYLATSSYSLAIITHLTSMPLLGQIENKCWKRAWCDPDRTLACVHSNQSFFAQTSLLAVSIFLPLHFRVNLRAPECTGKVRASDASEDRWLVFGEIGRRLLFPLLSSSAMALKLHLHHFGTTLLLSSFLTPAFFNISIYLCYMVWHPPNSLPLGMSK
jgi:hypothetical protein